MEAYPDKLPGSTRLLSRIKSSSRRLTQRFDPVPGFPTGLELDLGKSPPGEAPGIYGSGIQHTYKSSVASSSTASLPFLAGRDRQTSNPEGTHQIAPLIAPTSERRIGRTQTVQEEDASPPSKSFHRRSFSAGSPKMLSGYSGGIKRDFDFGKPPTTSHGTSNYGLGQGSITSSGPQLAANPSVGGLQNPSTLYQHIQDVSAKRISTLDYLKKSHDSRVYWLNTLLFSRGDLSKMPAFESKKLARRATNYLLLGLSLPTVLDLNASNPLDYLRALNALLLEFETYQQIHPPDGSTSSSLSRARIPQMFKRAAHGGGAKGRRTSSATEIGLPMGSSDPSDLKSMTGSVMSSGSSASSFPVSEQDLLPGEEYAHLLTPSLPFDPDFFETFATLCDVLIDCYTRIMGLINSPMQCAPGVAEIFAKADTRLRKVMVSGIVKDFEDASRAGVKNEIAGIGKVVLGGLM